MLREVRSAFICPRLDWGKYTVGASTVSDNSAPGVFSLARTGTGAATATFTRAFGRTPVIVGSAASADVAAGGFVGVASPTAQSASITTFNASASGDNGTAHIIALGYDCRDSTRYTPTTGLLHARINKTRVEGFYFTGAAGAVTIGGGFATGSKTATGVYLFTLKRPFGSSNISVVATATSAHVCMIGAVTASTIEIKTFLNNGSAADVTACHVLVCGTDMSSSDASTSAPVKNSQRKPRILGFGITYSSGVPSLTIGTGDATLADTATGSATLTFTKAFARQPIVVASVLGAPGLIRYVNINSASTTATNINTKVAAGSNGDPGDGVGVNVICLGWDDVSEY